MRILHSSFMGGVPSLLGCLWALWSAQALAADQVPRAVMQRFNEVSLKAERLLESKGPDAAIAVYEESLLTDGDFGRVHLRLGQLYQEQDRLADAAGHYRACEADERVDALDRELICQRGLEQVTAPLEITGLPPDGRVVIIEPALFAGPHRSGARLPRGVLKVMVEVPGHEERASQFRLDGPLRWQAALGPRRGEALIPDEFIGETPDLIAEEPRRIEAGGVRWPAYAAAGVGAALVGVGLYLGLDNRATLDDIRARQEDGGCGRGFCSTELADAESRAALADGLWIGGAVVAASSVLFYFLFDEEAP